MSTMPRQIRCQRVRPLAQDNSVQASAQLVGEATTFAG